MQPTIPLLIAFLTSTLMLWAVVSVSKYKQWFLNESDLEGVQKFHYSAVPRIGGLFIYIAWPIATLLIDDESGLALNIWVSSMPVFIIGLYEDLSAKATPFIRLFAAFLSIAIAFYWLGIGIFSLGFDWVDSVLSSYSFIAILFTLLVAGGAINSLNIIDGFNGLLGGYCILAFMAMAYVAYILGDQMILHLSLISVVSTIGFFIFNFPFGKIFMGDGGAYFLGFMLAATGLVLVDRNEELSNWFVLLIFIYPMYELLYSIYRRKFIHNTAASRPDANHLHSLVYRKLISCDFFKHNKTICNSAVSPVMWLLSLLGIIPAVVWFDNQTMLITWAFVFMAFYTIVYRRIENAL